MALTTACPRPVHCFEAGHRHQEAETIRRLEFYPITNGDSRCHTIQSLLIFTQLSVTVTQDNSRIIVSVQLKAAQNTDQATRTIHKVHKTNASYLIIFTFITFMSLFDVSARRGQHLKAFWTIGSPCSLKHVRPRARLVGCSGRVQKDEAEAGTELQSVADHVVSASACFCRSRKAWLPTCSHIANCTSTQARKFRTWVQPII